MKQAKDYTAVEKFPIFKGYLDHFNKVSIDNDIPGMLSFFFVQGQVAVPYVRIPWDQAHLDPRVHCFWIQSSRTGKSIAWEFVGDIMRDCGLPSEMYTSGTDAGLIGGYEIEEDDGVKTTVLKEGMLAGRKGLNFDEGSIILNPNRHSQETVLYLQSACNPVGSNGNELVKHTKLGTVRIESLVSLWITTYPPRGVKEYVLTKGIFQRVLLYWSHWNLERRMNVSMTRASRVYKTAPKMEVTYEDLTNYFGDREKWLRDKVLELNETSFIEWDSMERKEREDLLQGSMDKMFSADDNTFYAALYDAIEDYYGLIEGLSPAISDVISSFVPAMENNTVVFATHMAIMERSWVVTGEHIDMAKEILYDLFKNLILWLEEEVDIGPKVAEKAAQKNKWLLAFQQVDPVDLGNKGDGWAMKSKVLKVYETQNDCSRGSAYNNFDKWANAIFQQSKDGRVVFLKLREDVE